MRSNSETRRLTLVSKRDAIEDPQVDCRILAATVLPYRETSDRSVVRKADNGNVYLAATSGDPNLPLPYGSDRSVLWWALNCGLETGGAVGLDRFPDYLKAYGLESTDAEYRKLRESLDRISALWLHFRVAKSFGSVVSWTLPVIRETHFSSRAEATCTPPQSPLWSWKDSWIVMAPEYLDLFRTGFVKLPPLLLRKINNHPTQWPLVLFLILRSKATTSPLTLPVRELRRLLGFNELGLRELREALTLAIARVKSCFPDFESQFDEKGDLRISAWHGIA